MRCCTIKLKRSWGYCPGCGEEIDWPPTRAQLIEQAKRHDEHLRRMAMDPVYKADHEMQQKMMKPWYDMLIREYAEEGPLLRLAGMPVDAKVATCAL